MLIVAADQTPMRRRVQAHSEATLVDGLGPPFFIVKVREASLLGGIHTLSDWCPPAAAACCKFSPTI